ncbi:MAG TPA: DUF362 domain-containing protein [Opitutaceae bacterium]|nr:DUF362 domain-containing protein [Opitutaceae bacterium]
MKTPPLRLGCLAIVLALTVRTTHAAEGFVPVDSPNSPMGRAVGVKPGRVAWAHEPRATRWDGTTPAPGWWADANTDPAVVAKMLAATVCSIGDARDPATAWDRLFRSLNLRRGRGDTPYRRGERIAIKLNLNQSRSHGDNGNASYIAPQLVHALVAELVSVVGVSPGDITCYDASREIPSTIYRAVSASFPQVHLVDSVGGDGRESARVDESHPLYLETAGRPLFFPTCVTQADYLINVAGLKGHTMAGMTVCAKNHLGTVLNADGSSAANRLHASIMVKTGRRGTAQAMGDYNGLVDLNGHEEIGPKTVLYVIDALYATRHNEYRLDTSCKWQSPPFDGGWTASVFASQDGIAIDSVALDFLRSEPTLRSIVTGTVDNYLHEAATAGIPGARRSYDPEKDGRALQSPGVHEHWNDAGHKQYSRNLGRADGIELIPVAAGR